MLLPVLWFVTLAQPCEHPVYLEKLPPICSEIAPTTAYGRVVVRLNGRTLSLNAAAVDLNGTLKASRGKPRSGSFSVVRTGGTGTPFVYRRITTRVGEPHSTGRTASPAVREPASRTPRLRRSEVRKLKMARARAERNLKTAALNEAMATSEFLNRPNFRNFVQAKHERRRRLAAERAARQLGEILDEDRR